MAKSRQEIGFELWVRTFVQLVGENKDMPHKKEVLAWWHDFFEHRGVRDNMLQAFTNFMWDYDDKVQEDVASELKMLLTMIPKVADPENENTKRIVQTLEELIDDATEPLDFQPANELNAEFSDQDLEEVGGSDPKDNTSLL